MNEPLLARRGLSLERLETFCKVAEAGSFVKAANRDPVRQSLYSRQIRELEEFFGAELIERHGRGIRLTSTGRRLAQMVREQFTAIREFQSEVKNAPVSLTLAAGSSVLEWAVAPLLPHLHQQFPNARITLLNKRSQEIVSDLQDFKLDVGIVRDDAVPKTLKSSPFIEFTYAFFVPRKFADRLTDKRLMERLGQIPLAVAESESFQRQFAQVARKADVVCRTVASCPSFTLAAELVSTGEFAAVLPVVAQKRLDASMCRMMTPKFLTACKRRLKIVWNPRVASVRPLIEKVAAELKVAAIG